MSRGGRGTPLLTAGGQTCISRAGAMAPSPASAYGMSCMRPAVFPRPQSTVASSLRAAPLPGLVLCAQEDETLRKRIKSYGLNNWGMVADGLPGRSGKSCSERCVLTSVARPRVPVPKQLLQHKAPCHCAAAAAPRTGHEPNRHPQRQSIPTPLLMSCRWRIYLTPGVKRPTQEPFNEYEVAVIYLVSHAGQFCC